MRYKTISIGVGISIIAISFAAMQSLASVPSQTVDYLNSQAKSNPWVLMALKAAGQSLSADSLSLSSVNSATDIERTILAVTAAGQNPLDFKGQDLVAQLDAKRNAGQMGEANLLNDDIWGILAYISAGYTSSDQRIADSVLFLLDNIAAEGGWGYAVNTESDSNDTAMAITALIRAGLPSSDSVIVNALDYLKTTQNDDGGFGIGPGSDSDSASTSWIISAIQAAGQDPASWSKSANTPFSYLDTVVQPDGSYKWKASDNDSNVVMTTYAAIALSETSYPVAVYQAAPLPPQPPIVSPPDDKDEVDDDDQEFKIRFRIEGSDDQICAGEVDVSNPLEVVEEASFICDFSYVIEETSFGPYLKQIGYDKAESTAGWLYLVNWDQASVGADQYQLKNNDFVTWYYGEFNWLPLQLSVENQKKIDDNVEVTIKVEKYQESKWTTAAGINVSFGDIVNETDLTGRVSVKLANGVYPLVAYQNDYVRSNVESVSVGGVEQQQLTLQTNVVLPTSPPNFAPVSIPAPEVSFSADVISYSENLLKFGDLEPGQANLHTIELKNEGDVKLHFTASVTGDQLFVDNFFLDQALWSDFAEILQPKSDTEVEASLEIPADYTNAGEKVGELIFWATP